MKARFILLLLVLLAVGGAAAQSEYWITTFRNSLHDCANPHGPPVEYTISHAILRVVGEMDGHLKINRFGEILCLPIGMVFYRRLTPGKQYQESPRVDNCCSLDRHCDTDEEWAAGYADYQVNSCSSQDWWKWTELDHPDTYNCCQIGWECHDDDDWDYGDIAFNANRCAIDSPPSASQPAASAQTNAAPQPSPDIDNCCFVDRECHSDADWTDGYWAFQNGQCQAPPQTQSPAPAPVQSTSGGSSATNIDNCCFVDRECHSDQDWTEGYWAFQNGQCQAPAGVGSGGPPPVGVDNCCQINRRCETDLDWQRGFTAYQHNLCYASPGDYHKINGSAEFVHLFHAALQLLLERAPEWYAYSTVIPSITEIPVHPDHICYVTLSDRKVYCWLDKTERYAISTGSRRLMRPWIVSMVRVVVHEACHIQRDIAGFAYTAATADAEEAYCYGIEDIAYRAVSL